MQAVQPQLTLPVKNLNPILKNKENKQEYSMDSVLNKSTSVSNTSTPYLEDLVVGSNIQMKLQQPHVELKKKVQIDSSLIDNALDFDNLNDCVAALLKKSKGDINGLKDVKRRQRKNKDQLKFLENEYNKNPNWSRDKIK